MNILDVQPCASSETDDGSSSEVYSIDFDLDLNLDVNINTITFDCPVWSENDAFSKELTDSILTENFTNIEEKVQPVNCEATFNGEQFFSDTSNAVTSDLIYWNSFQGVEQLYNNNNNIKDTADLLIYEMESPSLNINNNNNEVKHDVPVESISDPCSFDILKDSIFELDLFGECLKEIDNIPTQTTSSTFDSFKDCTNINPPIIEWNRRRSLLYDKNEFIRNPSEVRTSCRSRQQEDVSRAKNTSISVRKTERVEEQRSYKCSVRNCEKTYCKASHLKSHMRRHSGFKPFACDWEGCKWRFSRSDELARHKRSHSGIKPYLCDLCDKAFSRSDHLSKHAKVHMKKLALYGTPIITKKCNYKYLTVNRIPVE